MSAEAKGLAIDIAGIAGIDPEMASRIAVVSADLLAREALGEDVKEQMETLREALDMLTTGVEAAVRTKIQKWLLAAAVRFFA